ncbi:MAG: alpha/beta hydrolase [Acidobacteriota bacterium]
MSASLCSVTRTQSTIRKCVLARASGVTAFSSSGLFTSTPRPLPLAAALHRQALQVLLVDYRGYGGNPGTPTEKGLAADSRAARAFVAGRSDVDTSRLVYLGESLGTAVAVDLAVDHPPAALILRSPLTSMSDIGRHHHPFLPVRLLLRDRFATIDKIRGIQVPLLVIAGESDRIVPIENGRRLYAAAAAPKTLPVIPDADHNDHELLAGDDMIRAVIRFLQPLW